MIRSADQEQKTSVTATAKQTDNLSPASDGVYSSTDYCSPSNDNWDAKDSTSTSFGYFSIGVGYTNLKNSFSNTSFTNTQPKFLGNPETNVSNPNYGDGMSLTTEDYVKLSPSSVIGSFEFGYNAALGQTKAFLGFFGGLKVFNASSSFPVFLTSVDYEVGEESGALIIEPESESTISAEYQTIISSRLSFNAGVLFGYKFNDRLFGYAKFGWTCLRTTSSKADESISGNGVVSSGYSPIYTNGLIYGFGVDLSITERLSIGVEAFGESYADRKMAVFAYQSNPGPQTQNSATSFGSSPSIQKLSADPMATTVLGVMLKLNIKFLER
ncbi:MAG: hypothetical protein FJX00_01345 [Alphaproteobacteria bacterium]|nr:hypothetical protein [Alphaproteobacteria bacterium]